MSLVMVFAGCTSNAWTLDLSNLNVGLSPTVTPAIQFDEWVTIQPGVDFKQLTLGTGPTTELLDVVRIDQTKAHLQLAIDEATPRTISSWSDYIESSVVVNGSYFDEKYHVLTRTVVDGVSYGKLLSGATGVLQQTPAGTWEIVASDGTAITADTALQSYPLLINNGEPFTGGSTDTAQRTVVALARDGTLYLIVAEYGVWSLSTTAAALHDQLDLDLTYALNLDGGTSTGLGLTGESINYLDDSLVVPTILYISDQNTL